MLPTALFGQVCIFGATAHLHFPGWPGFLPISKSFRLRNARHRTSFRLPLGLGILRLRPSERRKPEWIRLTVIDSGFWMGALCLSLFTIDMWIDKGRENPSASVDAQFAIGSVLFGAVIHFHALYAMVLPSRCYPSYIDGANPAFRCRRSGGNLRINLCGSAQIRRNAFSGDGRATGGASGSRCKWSLCSAGSLPPSLSLRSS